MAPQRAMLYHRAMRRKTGILVFTHGSRLKEGNEIVIKLVEQLRERLGYEHIEPCFMELGKPLIPVAIKKLVSKGCNHIFGYAFFLVPGRTCARTSRSFSSRR